MLKTERHIHILHELNLHNRVLSAALCNAMNVSEDTIRRDLQELYQQGKLIKVHGGAIVPHPKTNGRASLPYAYNEKRVIAQKAAKLIKEGSFVVTSGGSTIIEMARHLSSDLRATIMSGSIPAIYEYMKHENLDVIVLGDKLNKNAMLTVGAEVINKLKRVRPDLCFLGVNAIDEVNGITDSDWEVVQVKQQMIQSSRQVVCLTISEKLNTVQPINVASLSEVDILITELDPENVALEAYRKAGVTIL